MPPTQLALARSHSYNLFGRLFLDGITAELFPFLTHLPELAAQLPHPFVADEMAALHYDLFHFQIFPYESVFLDTTGLMGGETAEQVQQHYQQMGWMPETAVFAPDHIGYELQGLAYLCQLESQNLTTQTQQTYFLHHHLLRWLPPFVAAVHETAVPFYTHLASLTLQLALDHAQTLPTPPDLPPFKLSAPPALLENERTSLQEIAAYLVTPALSGMFISRGEIGRLARMCQLPHGFGSRADRLRDLFLTAGAYDKLPALLGGLQGVWGRWEAVYAEMEGNPYTAVWQTRLQNGRLFLQQITHESVTSV